MNAFVVESPAIDGAGKRIGTFRHWVATEERARSEAAKAPGRTWRAVPEDEVPVTVSEGFERSYQQPSTTAA